MVLSGTHLYHKLGVKVVGTLRGEAAALFMPMCTKHVSRGLNVCFLNSPYRKCHILGLDIVKCLILNSFSMQIIKVCILIWVYFMIQNNKIVNKPGTLHNPRVSTTQS